MALMVNDAFALMLRFLSLYRVLNAPIHCLKKCLYFFLIKTDLSILRVGGLFGIIYDQLYRKNETR